LLLCVNNIVLSDFLGRFVSEMILLCVESLE